MTSAPPMRPPMRAPLAAPKPPTSTPSTKTWAITSGKSRKAYKLGIYGEAGVGKSTLASLCADAVFADIEDSMVDLDVQRVAISDWDDLRAWVQAQRGVGRRGLDTMTQALDMCVRKVIASKKQDGQAVESSLEDFKYKAGARFVYDEFRLLLSDIEASYRSGMSWIMLAHDRVTWFRNPDDKDYKRHAPDLLEAKDFSVTDAWVRFCDHIAFIDRDVSVAKGGKATGGLSRTIYMDGAASRVCKQRDLGMTCVPWNLEDPNFAFWQTLNASVGSK